MYTKEEWNTLRSQIATANTPEEKAIAFLRSQFATTKNLSKIRTLPYAFTRNGIGMLSSELGSETATIHSRYYESFQTDLKKHNEQYREIKFIQLPQKNHDRFLIIDDDVYLFVNLWLMIFNKI